MLTIRNQLPASPGTPALPDQLGFGRVFTDAMFVQDYSAQAGWHDARIVPYQPLVLDPAAQAFHSGQMVFDGTKAYRRPDGNINLFRVERNAQRFERSAQRMGMPAPAWEDHVEAIVALVRAQAHWVPHQPGAALYIRPVLIGVEPTLEVRSARGFLHYIILSPVGPYFGGGFEPVSVYVSHDYVRAVRGGTGEAKTPGNYAGSLYATEQANARGHQQVLWLDAVERRYVDEVGAMNIAFVYQGRHIRTPALSGSILAGVTRESILQLAPDLGFTIEEARIDFEEVLRDAENGTITEAFGMGTGAVIAPVGRLVYQGREVILNGFEPGPAARTLYEALTAIQYGRRPDPYGWTRVVEATEAGSV
ncbi:MAG: branched-chain amino acid aminotransferase [Burkholderiales bacterium]|nr:branched-chain amino acid aminotransferase [Burkholderiales bacterium]